MKNNKINLDILSCIFVLGVLVIPIMFALIIYQPKPMDDYEKDTEVVIEETEKIEAAKINAEIIEESETAEEIIEEEKKDISKRQELSMIKTSSFVIC